MAELLTRTWRSRDFWLTVLGALVLVAGAFWLATRYVKPAPPKHIVMAVGAPGGAYESYGQQFKAALAQEGIELELRNTNGALDNLRLLKDEQSGVTLAFVQGGVAHADAPDPGPDGEEVAIDEGLMALASLYYEPLWVFYRGRDAPDRLQPLLGKRIAVGRLGSGARVLAEEVLAANGIKSGNTTLLEMTAQEAAKAVEAGEVDVAMLVGAPESTLVTHLMHVRDVKLMSFAQAEAYSRQFPYLARVVLPEGGFDLGANIPAHDVQLVAPTANLIAREDIHPALISLLMSVATDIHGGAGLLHREGEFPSTKGLEIGLSFDSERYLKSGPSFLHRYLPFWIAVWADRLVVMLIPLIAVLLPVMRLAPAVYAWRVKSRIYRWYGRLKELEYEIDLAGSTLNESDVAARLADIELGASKIPTPLAFAENLYNLRAHIELVRQRLMQAAAVRAQSKTAP
jgi:TRAP transporter TAXI family solute receptor